MNSQDIRNILGPELEAVKALVRSRLSSDVPILQDLNMRVAGNSGKFLRPILTLLMARACSGGRVSDDTRLFAAAVEMLHTATLFHDDVADGSDTRRGAPTAMSVFGPVPAVLVGDFWLARAVGLIADSNYHEWGMRAFARTFSDLAEGEMLQQQKASLCDTTEEEYLRIIYCKTASLFRLCAECGAKTVEAPPALFEAASEYSRAMGLAFQIKDDILDFEGGDIGKPAGVDLKERKITLPLLGALKGVSDPQEIRGMVKDIEAHPGNASVVNKLVLEGGGIDYAYRVLHDYVISAIDSLQALPHSRDREMLEELALLNETRKK